MFVLDFFKLFIFDMEKNFIIESRNEYYLQKYINLSFKIVT